MFTSIRRALITLSMISVLAAAGTTGIGEIPADRSLTDKFTAVMKAIDLRVEDGVAELKLKKDGQRVLVGKSDLVEAANGFQRSPWAGLGLVPLTFWILGPMVRMLLRRGRRSTPRARPEKAPVPTGAGTSSANGGLKSAEKPALRPVKVKQVVGGLRPLIDTLRTVELRTARYQPKHASGARR